MYTGNENQKIDELTYIFNDLVESGFKFELISKIFNESIDYWTISEIDKEKIKVKNILFFF